MKNKIVSMCAAIVVVSAMPALALVQAGSKNECILYGRYCPDKVDSLPEQISRLKTEIAKGEKVYAPKELRLLDRRLLEDNFIMRSITKPGK